MKPKDQEEYDEAMGQFIMEDFSFRKKLENLRFLPYALVLPFVSIPIGKEKKNAKIPWVTITLIAVNVLVFLFFPINGTTKEDFFLQYGFIPAFYRSIPEAYRFITSMFLHANFLHIFGNMLFLWIFGALCENVLSKVEVAGYYLITGVVGSVLFGMFTPEASFAIGASGAISGLLGVCLVLLPTSKIILLGTRENISVPISVWYYVFVWLALQLFNSYMGANPGIGYIAHLGSFFAGVCIALLLKIFHAIPKEKPLPFEEEK